jgi:hypothetical protein
VISHLWSLTAITFELPTIEELTASLYRRAFPSTDPGKLPTTRLLRLLGTDPSGRKRDFFRMADDPEAIM